MVNIRRDRMMDKNKCTIGEIKKQLYNIVKKEFDKDIQDLTDRVYMLECIVQESLPMDMVSVDLDKKEN
jgi:hypothetical protein